MSPRRAHCAQTRARWVTATLCTQRLADAPLHSYCKPSCQTPSFVFLLPTSQRGFASSSAFQPARLHNANAAGVEQCLGGCRRRDVDLHGNHAHAPCKVCLLGRGHRHRYLKNAVSHHATKVGCIASWVKEDSTAELLLRQFSPLECSTMFPLTAPAELVMGARQQLEDLRAATKLPSDQRETRLSEIDVRLLKLRESVADGHGLRLDGTIMDPASGEQVWFDVSAVHTTCKTHLKCEVKHTRERRAAGARDNTRRL